MFKGENGTQRRCERKAAGGSGVRGLILLNLLRSSNTLDRAGWLCICETTSAAPRGFHPFHVAEAWARGFTSVFTQACVVVSLLISNTLTDVTKTQVCWPRVVPHAHARTKTLKWSLTDFRVACFLFPSLFFTFLMFYLFCKHVLPPSLSQFISIPVHPCYRALICTLHSLFHI